MRYQKKKLSLHQNDSLQHPGQRIHKFHGPQLEEDVVCSLRVDVLKTDNVVKNLILTLKDVLPNH